MTWKPGMVPQTPEESAAQQEWRDAQQAHRRSVGEALSAITRPTGERKVRAACGHRTDRPMSVRREGGGNWQRAGHMHRSTACPACVADVLLRCGPGELTYDNWSIHGALRAAEQELDREALASADDDGPEVHENPDFDAAAYAEAEAGWAGAPSAEAKDPLQPRFWNERG